MATAVLITAALMLVMSIRSRIRPWIIVSAAGLAFVLLAFASGNDYIATLHRSADDYMGIGWFGAIVTYGTGWYLSRRAARRDTAPRSARRADAGNSRTA